MATRSIRITHRPTGELLAAGPLGWAIRPFEGNLYISRRHLLTSNFEPNYIPGFCPYKFFYVWLDFRWEGGVTRNLGWLYWLPNPMFPFICYRVGVPRDHPELLVEELSD